jgi:hypothetical protein
VKEELKDKNGLQEELTGLTPDHLFDSPYFCFSKGWFWLISDGTLYLLNDATDLQHVLHMH